MGNTRCDYIPMWSSSTHRCDNGALVRLLHRRLELPYPDYRERCLTHAGLGAHETVVIAYRDPAGQWHTTGRGR